MSKQIKKSLNLSFSIFLILLFLLSLTKCIIEIPIQSFEFNSLSLKNESISVDGNGLLVGKVKLGSNNKEFNLLLDTTSSISWVAKEGSKDEYPITNHYDPSKSSTSNLTDNHFEINKFDYHCKGDYYEDQVQFLEDKKINLKLGVANETKINVREIDGMIGLAYNYEDENLSFLNSLKKSGITDSLSFSITIDENEAIKKSIGTMYLGKHADFSTNETVSCPLKFDKYKDYWAYNIKSFILSNTANETKSDKTFQVIFDTASNVIILPVQYFIDINNGLSDYECKYATYGELSALTYALACTDEKKLPNIKLKINGQKFILPKEHIFYKLKDVYYSKVIFQGENGIIGTPFFSLFHTMFDKEKKMLRFYPKKTELIERGEIEEKEDNGNNQPQPEPEPEKKGFDTTYLYYIIPSAVVVIVIIVVLIILCIRNQRGKHKESFVLGLQQNDEENALTNEK